MHTNTDTERDDTTVSMTSSIDDQDGSDYEIGKAIEAARTSDAALVASLLGCKRSLFSGLDEPLHPSTALATKLLDRISNQHCWKTIMMIPASYETPWRAVVPIVEESRSNTDSWEDLTGIQLVKTFLQHTFSTWWKQEREAKHDFSAERSSLRSLPRVLLLELADVVLKPLLEEGDESRKISTARHWVGSLDLIASIVYLCRELEGGDIDDGKTSLAGKTLDKVFGVSIHDACILPWLSLASDLKAQLRQNDWKVLLEKLEFALSNVPCKIPPSDLPGIARSVLVFLPNGSAGELTKRWRQLLPKLLTAASQDIPTYSTVEALLRSTLSSFSTLDLLSWWSSLCSPVDCDRWISANVHLLFLHASQQSGSQLVTTMLAQALGTNGIEYINLPAKCWESLVQLQLPASETESSVNSCQNLEEVQELLLEIYYQGDGVFKHRDTLLETNLSTEVVCKSIFFGDRNVEERSNRLHAAERAQLWVDASNQVLKRHDRALTAGMGSTKEQIQMAVLIVVTIYCEIPESRASLVRMFINHIVDGSIEASLHCIALKMIVQTFQEKAVKFLMKDDDFNQFADVFGQSLEEKVFFDLVDALSPLCALRPSMILLARKMLNTPIVWWDTKSSRGSRKEYQGIRCALHLLCCLIGPNDVDGFEAWVLLSDIIVINKPALPLSVRSWFLKRLALSVKKRHHSETTMGCLLRAFLARTLHFFDDNAHGIVFVPSRIFVTWGTGPVRTNQQECLLDLLLVIIALVEHHNKVSPNKHTPALFCGLTAEMGPTSLHNGPGGATYHNYCYNWDNVSDCCTTTKMTVACLLAIYRTCVCSSQGIETPPVKFTEGLCNANHVGIWRSQLVEEEQAQRPKSSTSPQLWMALPGTDKTERCDLGMQEIGVVLHSLCNLFLDFLISPLRGSLLHNTETSDTALSFSFVVKIKRDLTDSGERITDGSWVSEDSTPHTITKFISYSSQLFQTLIQDKKRPAVEAELILAAVLDCCLLLTSQFESPNFSVSHDTILKILRATLALYRAVGTEEKSIKLISYLEEKCMLDTHRRSFYSFLQDISTDKDVDDAIRCIRCSILNLLASCLQRMKDLQPATLASISEDVASGLGMFCRDLRIGLEGDSGGVTDEMYRMFLDSIELLLSISARITDNPKSADPANSILRESTEGGTKLFDIVCTFPVRSRSLFKRTLHLAMHSVPTLGKSLAEKVKKEHTEISTSVKRTHVVMRQCLPLLEKLYQHINIPSKEIPWFLIAGSDHVSVDLEDNMYAADDLSMDSQTPFKDIPSEVAVCLIDAAHKQDENASSKKLQILTPKHLYWALEVAVNSMELACEESLAVMRSSQPSNQASGGHAKERGEYLRETLSCVCQVLKPRKTTGLFQGTSLARGLPKTTKMRVCSLLAKLIATLQRAVYAIEEYVEKGFQSRKIVAESLTIMSTWFSTTLIGDDDLVTLFRQWLHGENRKKSDSIKDIANHSEDPVSSRLLRIVIHADQLERSIHNLRFLLCQQDTKVKNRILRVNEALAKIADDSGEGREASLSQLLTDHIGRTSKSGFPLLESAEALELKHKTSVPKKRKRHDRQLRSRNQIVDTWLHLDQSFDDGDDDAYVDLEDFLADG
jgi:hypothetical protein